jgi:hypothetical protein
MLLKELYEPFAEFLCKENINLLYQLVTGEEVKIDDAKISSSGKAKTKKAKPVDKQKLTNQFIDAVKDPVIRFIKTASLFLDGASGKYDPFVSENAASSIDAKIIWQHAEKYLERLINIESLAANPELSNDKTSAAFIADLIKTMKAKSYAAIAYSAGYGLCIILRDVLGSSGHEAKLLIDHWHLDRKFREAYQSLNIRGDEAWRVVEIFKGLLKRTAPAEYNVSTPKALTKLLIDEALVSSEYKDVLGLNQFDNTIWFNKECFDDTLFYASLFVVLENADAFKAAKTVRLHRIKATAETVKLLKAAEKKAGYKLEELKKLVGK